jgi:RNA-directed DNA polymerase
MLAPQPGRTGSAPRPTKILSKAALLDAWNASRDSKTNAGGPGIDNVSARQFSTKLDSNLSHVARQLREGRYGFSKLRVVFVPKQNSDAERVICIPTVRDRLVQRAIGEYLTSRSILPITNASSFGFIRGRGPQGAISKTIELRQKYDWCLKTDIQSFFDSISRQQLKTRVTKFLGGSSLESIMFDIIDCEVKITSDNRQKLLNQGLAPGRGVRQGMPLSPILANLALVDFDRHVESRKINMVRYADDLVLFFRSKDEAEDGRRYIKILLATFDLTIPELENESKTKIVSRLGPLDFLGREIVFLESNNSFVARVGKKQIKKINNKLNENFSLANRLACKSTFQDTIVDLSRSVAAYLGIYKDVHNYNSFEHDLNELRRSIVAAIFKDLFGYDTMRSFSSDKKRFLGIDLLGNLEANFELDI